MSLDPSLLTSTGSFTGDPAALTLADLARYLDSTRSQATIKTLYEMGNALGDCPFITDEGALEQKVKRFTGKSIPRSDFMPPNLDPRAAKFTPEDYLEKAYIVRNFVDVDTVYLRAKNQIQNIQQMTPSMYLYSFTKKYNDYLINNDHITGDILGPVGIKYRLADPLNPLPADLVVNAGGLDLSSAVTAANAIQATFLFDEMFTSMDTDTGEGIVGYTNHFLKNAYNRALKVIPGGGGYNTTKDNFDRREDRYAGAKITDLGRKVDQISPVVGLENSDGTPNASGNYTSIYFVRYGSEQFHGWHWGAPSWDKAGVIDNRITSRMFFEYIFGWMNPNLRSLGRIYGIKVK